MADSLRACGNSHGGCNVFYTLCRWRGRGVQQQDMNAGTAPSFCCPVAGASSNQNMSISCCRRGRGVQRRLDMDAGASPSSLAAQRRMSASSPHPAANLPSDARLRDVASEGYLGAGGPGPGMLDQRWCLPKISDP